MGARKDVLNRIRSALSDVPSGEPAEGGSIPRNYRRHRSQPEGALERFCERVADYKATIQQVHPDEVAAAVHEALRRAGATRVGVPEGLPSAWTAAAQEITLIRDTSAMPLSTAELDELDAVVTGS